MSGDGAEVALPGGRTVVLRRRGEGPPLLFLHPHTGLAGGDAFLKRLAAKRTVLAPSHPGFDEAAPAEGMTTVDDLAYHYLDLIEALDLRDICLVGASFGGWVALALAIKSTARVRRLVLLDALGVRFAAPGETEIADIFSMTRSRFAELAFHDPAAAGPDPAAMTPEERTRLARHEEGAARYGWNPYMHDPKLRRQLHRVGVPALVLWGAADRIVSTGYGRRLADALPDATFAAVDHAGHFPHVEQPVAVAERILAFDDAVKPAEAPPARRPGA